MRPALFLDRDGVLNEEVDYLCRVEDARLIPGVATALSALNRRGVPVVVVSNQSGLARRRFTEAELEAVQRELERQLLAEADARVDDWLYCPFHPSFSDRYAGEAKNRKPEPGMLREAAKKHDLDLSRSLIVGDKASDLLAGERAGCGSVLVRTGYGAETERALRASETPGPRAFDVFDDLPQALPFILERLTGAPPR